MSDLRKCDLLVDWRKTEQERAAWKSAVKMMTEKLNEQLADSEKERKDEQKMGKEEGVQPESAMLRCVVLGCTFVGQTKADLVNHTR